MNLRNLAMLLLCLCFLGTTACDLKQSIASQTSQTKQSLLEEMGGVWRTEGNELITLTMADGRLQMLVDDTFVPVQVGDTDEENETANLKLRMADGRDVIWTLRKIKDENSRDGAFHLNLVTHEGKATELGFVRKISTDDLNRIASVDKPQVPQASVLASIIGESAAADEAIPDAAAASVAQAAADAAAATAAAAAEGEAGKTASDPIVLTDGDGISYSVERNDDGVALVSDNATIYVGVSCDAFSPQYGKASWGWLDGTLTVDFGNRRIVFQTPVPKFVDSSCLG